MINKKLEPPNHFKKKFLKSKIMQDEVQELRSVELSNKTNTSTKLKIKETYKDVSLAKDAFSYYDAVYKNLEAYFGQDSVYITQKPF